jgi:hypothetical protein
MTKKSLVKILVNMNCLMLFKFVANLYIVQPQGEHKIFFFWQIFIFENL